MAATSAGTVNTTWKYGAGNRSACRDGVIAAMAEALSQDVSTFVSRVKSAEMNEWLPISTSGAPPKDDTAA